ncbi:TonB-dependent receptor plug domain-containing protein [Phenylobacterium sp.]|jgi:iron complex outermembrane receptor protein|uniref:TonB-dependent receptor plug domain-containing protein n=1 Tax=Phenylobacterium sp. TaxID=1871053 RepID=UPI002F938D3B
MKKFLFAAGFAGLALAGLPAAAQSIDYGSLEQLFNEPVTTSATGSPQRAPEAPADMQIISQEDIRRSGATDLPTIISRVAGVDVLNFSAGHTDVNVRGYNQSSSPRLLVLVNGRQVYMDHYGLTFWRNIPVQLQEIRQIEVVKGPNTALFGFNAVSGVVNIITFNPKFDDVDAFSVRVGTNDYKGASLVATGKLGERLSARISLGAEKQDEWKNTIGLTDMTRTHAPENVSAAIDTVAQLSDKTELRVEGSYSNVQQSTIAGAAYSPTKSFVSSVKATLASETKLGLVQVSAYQNDLTAKYIILGRTEWENRIRVVSAQDLFKIGAAHTFRVGAEYRNNTLNTAPLKGGEIGYDVFALSGMWNWQVSDKLATTVALRHDTMEIERTGTFPPGAPLANNALWDRKVKELSVNAAVVFRPTADDTIRLSYGRGVQAPTLVELGGLSGIIPVGPGVNLAFVGNPTLRPSIVENYQVSYDRNLPVLNAKAGVRVFWQQWEDIKGLPGTGSFDVAPTRTTLPGVQFINTSDSEMQGFELSASGRAKTGFRWSADYTYTDVKDEAFRGVNPATRGTAFERMSPKHRGNVAAGWSNKAWEADAFLHYVGKFDSPRVVGTGLAEVDAFTTLGGRVAHKLDNGLTFAVAGQNLLHERQKQTNGFEAERRVFVSVSKAW